MTTKALRLLQVLMLEINGYRFTATDIKPAELLRTRGLSFRA